MMKIICTTSDKYHHLLPIFSHLFNRAWSKYSVLLPHVEVVGYAHPSCSLPLNFSFHSLGKQGVKTDFSNDLRPYFAQQKEWFIWVFEDTFIKSIDFDLMFCLIGLTEKGVGRINLSTEGVKQDHVLYDKLLVNQSNQYTIFANTQTARYRLSTQPSIWNRDFLLHYLKPDLSPWDFETQPSVNDGYKILGSDQPAFDHNEGVRRFDIHKYNFDGFDPDVLEEMRTLNLI